MKHIVLLVDLTGVAHLALEHTAIIARRSICRVTLLHIASDGMQSQEKEIKNTVREFASTLENDGILFAVQINYGNFFEVIAPAINAMSCDLLIVGTHGIKGFKHNFMSSNIIKLMNLLSVPALIVQGHSTTPQEGYNRILVPIIGAIPKENIEKPLAQFASLFHSTLHFLAYCNTHNVDDVHETINQLQHTFTLLGFPSVVQIEEIGVYAGNHSRSIVQYSDIEDIDVILLFLHEKDNMKNFNDEDKENILLNRFGKAVLCL
ncbi:MAG TPA: universal stress protein [Candidatus Kapabacteria bacterium]|jgi:nucleotide-binding universal stress UspA family protein|nr:universal stress protein [Ignavibacteria bacterium]HRE58765.1 universal stress protein [Candidatus Kapabacteria bacterium]